MFSSSSLVIWFVSKSLNIRCDYGQLQSAEHTVISTIRFRFPLFVPVGRIGKSCCCQQLLSKIVDKLLFEKKHSGNSFRTRDFLVPSSRGRYIMFWGQTKFFPGMNRNIAYELIPEYKQQLKQCVCLSL